MPAEGWYSGDDHCHVRRDGVTDHTILQWTKAEDVHVSNIVQMGDINRLYFLQYAWGDEGMAVDGDYVLRTGQEDPRTFVNGHTLMFNLTNAIHDRDSYYIYSDALDAGPGWAAWRVTRTGALSPVPSVA